VRIVLNGRRTVAALLLLLSLLGLAGASFGGEPESRFQDPALEARFMALTQKLRCLVCQGQSIAESDSGFAADVKREIYKKMKGGETDEEIVDFLVQRYGDFILFKPPLKATTVLLWVGPALLLLAGGTALGLILVRRRREAADPLTDDDLKRAESLLSNGDTEEESKI
jgi:cytochrome c-type biogenesis protein CcmH